MVEIGFIPDPQGKLDRAGRLQTNYGLICRLAFVRKAKCKLFGGPAGERQAITSLGGAGDALAFDKPNTDGVKQWVGQFQYFLVFAALR